MTDIDIKDVEEKSKLSERDVLVVAKVKAQNAVNKEPTAANLSALEKATKMLADLQMEEPEPAVANRLEVMKHLRREGFKIGKSKLYKDSAAGLLKIQPDGSVLERDIDRYVRVAGLKKPAEISDGELQILQKKKNEMEVRKLEAQVSDLTFKQAVAQGRYIPRAEFEMEMAGRAGALDAGLRHRFLSECRDLVDAVSGDPALVPIIQEMLGKMLDEALNEYASLDNFQVIIDPGSA